MEVPPDLLEMSRAFSYGIRRVELIESGYSRRLSLTECMGMFLLVNGDDFNLFSLDTLLVEIRHYAQLSVIYSIIFQKDNTHASFP
jgi:hypothetical protein